MIKYVDFYLKKNQEKEDFITQLNAKMKNPLHAVLGSLDLLSKHKNFSKEQRELLKTAQNNGEILMHFINNILTTSKMNIGEVEAVLKSVDIRAILDKAFESKKPSQDTKDSNVVKNLIKTFQNT